MKNCLRFLLAGALLYCAHSISQAQVTFERYYGSTGARETAKSAVWTADGNLALLGTNSANGSADLYLLKITPAGDTLWTRRFGGPDEEAAGALLQLPDGGFMLVGTTRSFGEGRDDAWLLRTDAAGAVQWTKTLGSIHRERGVGIVPAPGGQYWVAVSYYTITTPTETGAVLYRIDASGNVLEEKFQLFDIAELTAAPGGGAFFAMPNDFVGKLDAQGNLLWQTDLAETIFNGARVSPLADGGCVASGRIFGGVRVARLNAQGDTVWTRVAPSNASLPHHAVQLPQSGHIALLYNDFDAGNIARQFVVLLNAADGGYLSGQIENTFFTNTEGNHLVVAADGSLYACGNHLNAGGDMLVLKLDNNWTPQWSETYGAPGPRGIDEVFSLIATSDGGFLLSGLTDQNGSEDVWYFKIGADGQVQWEKAPATPGKDEVLWSATPTLDGGIAFMGYEDNRLLLMKTDAQGNVLWKRTSIEAIASFGNILQTADGGLAVAVTAVGTGMLDATVIKYSAAGDSLWRMNYGASTQDLAFTITELPDEGLLLAGRTRVTGSFSNNALLVRTDADGAVLWERNFGGAGTDRFVKAAVGADGNYWALGYRRAATATSTQGWLVQVSPAGDSLWSRTFTGLGSITDIGYYDLLPLPDGGFIVVANATVPDGDSYERAGYVLRLDAAGEIVWERFFGTGKAPILYTSAPAAGGGYGFAGIALHNGSTDAYFVRTDADGLVSFFTPPTDLPSPLSLAPNPARGETWLTYDDAAFRGELRVTLVDANGRVVRTRLDRKDADEYRTRLDRQGLPAGVYTVHVSGGTTHCAARVVFME